MDSITQAALGGVVGELVLGRQLGWRGAAWGLFFGTLPDLDIIFYPLLDEVGKLRWHRGLSHSVVMMVAGAFLFAKPLAWWYRDRGLTERAAGWFVFWVWSSHVLIDVFTTYGTQIFEPFSDHRVAWNNLFIIDPFFTLPLLGCLVVVFGRSLRSGWERWRWRRDGSDPEDEPEAFGFSRRTAGIALSLSGIYVAFSFVMKLWATQQMTTHLEDEIPYGKMVAVAPTPLNTILWRGLIETDTGYFVTYWSPFDLGTPHYDFVPKQRELASKFEDEELFETLKWFSRGHWVARPGEDDSVVLIDVRFGEVRLEDEKRSVPTFQWRMRYDDQGRMEAPQYRPEDLDIGRSLVSLGRRILGRRKEWEEIELF